MHPGQHNGDFAGHKACRTTPTQPVYHHYGIVRRRCTVNMVLYLRTELRRLSVQAGIQQYKVNLVARFFDQWNYFRFENTTSDNF